ncbi:hypothetical protein D3C83_111450 [compost metagenome]
MGREGSPRRGAESFALGLDRELLREGSVGEERVIDLLEVRVFGEDRLLDRGCIGV